MTLNAPTAPLADLSEARDHALHALGPAVWRYLEQRADGAMTDRNMSAWSGINLRPRILRGVGDVDTRVTILGRTLAAPILTAPNGRATRFHPDGEAAVMGAAEHLGVGVVLGSSVGHALSALAQIASPPLTWSQIYLTGEPDQTRRAADRAAQAGCQALVVTVDLVPGVPAPESLPPLVRAPWEPPIDAVRAAPLYAGAGMGDLRALARASALPVVVKGVLRPDDAIACVEAGAAALIVSNHGDAQLAGALPTAMALAAVVDAVGDRAEVYVDGGVRSGADIVRALALGARAVLVGRPVSHGLGWNGQAGVAAVLDWLRRDLERTMALCGAARLGDIKRDLVD